MKSVSADAFEKVRQYFILLLDILSILVYYVYNKCRKEEKTLQEDNRYIALFNAHTKKNGDARMNNELREQHMQTIKNPDAMRMYDYLCNACNQRQGGITDTEQITVADIVQIEQIKQQLFSDIAKHGTGEVHHNGHNNYWQENESAKQLRAYAEQQRELLSKLKLIPASIKKEGI